MDIDNNDRITFSSGRRVTANLGIIGLAPDLTISGGYDNGFDDDQWTADEKRELADYMIALWAAYKAKL